VVKAIVIALACAASVARADSPKLIEARRAVAAVDYGAAQRLLVEALDAGGCTPSELREIYRLSARAAIVLGQSEVGEQYYRRWLAIDPAAALPDDTAPKLREPFVAAQAYIAAHGRLVAAVERDVDATLVIISTDPLAMAHGVAVGAAAPTPLDGGHRATIEPGDADRVAVVDEHGNHLVELAVPRAPIIERPLEQKQPPPAQAVAARPWTRRWITWAIPTGVCAALVVGFGAAALAENGDASNIADNSSTHFYNEVTDSVHRARVFAGITAVAGAGMIGFGIPTAIYFFQERSEKRTIIVPTGNGVAITGHF
jgi:hypothetical protein